MAKYKQVEVIYILKVGSKKYSIDDLQTLFINPSNEVIKIWDKLPHVKKLSEENLIEFEARSYDYIDLEESLNDILKNINLESFNELDNDELRIELYIPIYSKYANPWIWIKKEHIKTLSNINAEISFDLFMI